MDLLELYNYWVFSILLMIGFYAVTAKLNLVKKLIGLSIFQSAVFLLYISMGPVEGGTAPIFHDNVAGRVLSNPLPSVLILTAIVVGVATTAMALALIVRIHESYGSIDEERIHEQDEAA